MAGAVPEGGFCAWGFRAMGSLKLMREGMEGDDMSLLGCPRMKGRESRVHCWNASASSNREKERKAKPERDRVLEMWSFFPWLLLGFRYFSVRGRGMRQQGDERVSIKCPLGPSQIQEP